MSEIKPCPFCGSLATLHAEGWGYHVRCNYDRNCGAVGPFKVLKANAIAAWNRRQEAASQDEGEPVGYTSQAEIDKQFGVFLGAPHESICVPLYASPTTVEPTEKGDDHE